jgi:hypothetical protein
VMITISTHVPAPRFRGMRKDLPQRQDRGVGASGIVVKYPAGPMRYFRLSETSRPTAFQEICCRHLQGTPKTETGRPFQLLAHIKLSHFPEGNNYPVYSPDVEAGGVYSYHERNTDRHCHCAVLQL